MQSTTSPRGNQENTRRRVLLSYVLILACVSLSTVLVTILLLYGSARKQQGQRLRDTVLSQAGLIEAVTRFDAIHSGDAHPNGARNATLSQIIDAHSHSSGIGETGEFTMAERRGDAIVFLLRHRHMDCAAPDSVAWSASEAEPMRRALKGQSGTCVALDYRGATVLAAFAPVDGLDVGLVSKVDLSEIRQPFIFAGLISCIITLIGIIIGTVTVHRVTGTLLTRLFGSEELLRKLSAAIDQNPVGVMILDATGVVEYANERFFSTTDRTAEEIIGRPLPSEQWALEDDRQPSWESIASGNIWRGEVQRGRQNGELLWEAITIAPIEDAVRKTANFLITKEDITNRKEAEERRREAEEERRGAEGLAAQVLRFAPDPVVVINAAGIVLSASESVEAVFGWTADELMGRNVSILMPEPHRSQHDDYLRSYLVTGRTHLLGRIRKLEGKRKDGEVFPIELMASRVESASIPLFVGVLRDLSVRAKLEEEREHARRLESIGQLAAGIAHEINTPTQYVGDNTRFLEESFGELVPLLEKAGELAEAVRKGTGSSELADELKAALKEADVEYLSEEVPRAIEQSLNGIDRVRKIVQSMKEFSHPGGEGMTNLDLNHAIGSTVIVASNEWKYVAEVETDFDPELPAVPCLPGEINQVVLNMIVNAAHAIADVVGDGEADKGTIAISTRRDGEFVELRIADTGPGIPTEARDKIFDPFFTTKAVGKGTGQGLSIAHSVVVKKHGGMLNFETEIGKGTTFIIRLPLEAQDVEELV